MAWSGGSCWQDPVSSGRRHCQNRREETSWGVCQRAWAGGCHLSREFTGSQRSEEDAKGEWGQVARNSQSPSQGDHSQTFGQVIAEQAKLFKQAYQLCRLLAWQPNPISAASSLTSSSQAAWDFCSGSSCLLCVSTWPCSPSPIVYRSLGNRVCVSVCVCGAVFVYGGLLNTLLIANLCSQDVPWLTHPCRFWLFRLCRRKVKPEPQSKPINSIIVSLGNEKHSKVFSLILGSLDLIILLIYIWIVFNWKGMYGRKSTERPYALAGPRSDHWSFSRGNVLTGRSLCASVFLATWHRW